MEERIPEEPNESKDFETELRKANGDRSATASALTRSDDRALHAWLREIGTASSIRVVIDRKAPRVWKGKTIGGVVDVVDEEIDEEWLRSKHGGGKFQIKAQILNAKNQYQYAGARTIEISGDPILQQGDHHDDIVRPQISEDSSTVKAAMSMTERLAEQAQKRAERLEDQMRDTQRPTGTDPALLSLIQDQMQNSRQEMADLRRQFSEPRGPTTTDSLLVKMVEGDNDRLAKIREVHEAELRMLRVQADDAVKRAEDRLTRLMDSQERAHEREVTTLRSAQEMSLKTLDMAHGTQVKVLEGQLAQTRLDLEVTKKELVELRAKKDKSAVEQMQEIMEIQEAVEDMRGGKDDDGPVWKQVLDGVMQSPLMEGIGNRIGQGPPQPPNAAQAAARRAAIQQARAAAGGTAKPAKNPGAPAAPAAPKLLPIATDDLKTAIGYLESAIVAGSRPEDFAQSAGAFVPRGVIQAIREEGIDGFLSRVQLSEDSPILTVAGRNYVRRVAKILTEGDTPE